MIKRIITGLVLVGIVLGLLYLRNIDTRIFHILAYGCSIIGTLEMLQAFGDRLTILQRSIVFAFSIVFAPMYVLYGATCAKIIAFTGIALCFFTLVFDFEKTTLESAGLALVGLLYPTYAFYPILLMNDLPSYSAVAITLSFVIAPMADTFAFFVGSLVGGKKMAPHISPKKTISGGIGGIFGGGVGAIIVWSIFKDSIMPIFPNIATSILAFIFIGCFGAFVAEIGDLLEGAIKRKLGIKDMGKILPGHGGILDRVDAILVCSMFVYLVFLFII